MISILSDKKRNIISVALSLCVWHIVSLCVSESILLCSPVDVLVRLGQMACTSSYYRIIAFSFLRITSGFLLAFVLAFILSFLSYLSKWVRSLLRPYVVTIRTVPVASFIIIALMWIKGRNLSILISFLMSFPVLYQNMLTGLDHTDEKLLQMTAVFEVPFLRKLRMVYLSQLKPYLISSVSSAVGFAWKAGIASEVISLASGSVGEMLYTSKIYFETPTLLAWTLTIVIVSLLSERVFSSAVERLIRGGSDGHKN